MRKRIILFSEGVTLSQIVRLVTLGRALDPAEYEVHFACSEFDERIFSGTGFSRHLVHSLEPRRVLAAVKSGRRLYDAALLRRQLAEDLALFERTGPDLVVGDFRWSLTISAPVFGVPHAALVNAYWSPWAERSGFPVPDHPILSLLGERLTERYFPVALPRVFEHFAAPVNALRKEHGLAAIGGLPEVLTQGDYVLYADPPSLVPTPGAPTHHVHLGYVPWAPRGTLPKAIAALPESAPVVYATLGSSGSIDALSLVLEALGSLPVTGLVSTAGRALPRKVPANVVLTDYVPGDLAARRADVVVSNGGSSTGYQALAEGTPVLGMPSNLDQFLATDAIEKHSAGLSVKARLATSEAIRSSVVELLESRTLKAGARRVSQMLTNTNAAERFRSFVADATRGISPLRGSARALASGMLLGAALGVLAPATGARASEAASSSDVPEAAELGEVFGAVEFAAQVPGSGGHVICALFDERGWLKKPLETRKARVDDHRANCIFGVVEPGTYAIVAFHDEDDDGDIDKNLIGLPTESWCASRNAPASFGPPRFAAAKFVVRGSRQRIECTM